MSRTVVAVSKDWVTALKKLFSQSQTAELVRNILLMHTYADI